MNDIKSGLVRPSLLKGAVRIGQDGSSISLSAVKKLIEQGADVNECNSTGKNILHYLIDFQTFGNEKRKELEQKTIEIFEALLQKGIDIDKLPELGGTPLMMAVRKGLLDVSKWLIEKDANIYVIDTCGQNVVHWLCMGEISDDSADTEKILNMLIDKGVPIDLKSNMTDIEEAENGVEKDVSTPLSIMMRKLHRFTDLYNKPPFAVANLMSYYINIMEILIDNGADVNVECRNKWNETETIIDDMKKTVEYIEWNENFNKHIKHLKKIISKIETERVLTEIITADYTFAV